MSQGVTTFCEFQWLKMVHRILFDKFDLYYDLCSKYWF